MQLRWKDLLLGLAGLYFGYTSLRKGLGHLNELVKPKTRTLADGVVQHKGTARSNGDYLETTFRGERKKTSAGDMRMTLKKISNLDDRIAQIKELAHKGKFEPEVIAWARSAVTEKCRKGDNGEQWCVPEKDTKKEIEAIFKKMRKEIRYTSDIYGADTYQMPSRTLGMKTADCLPVGTLLLNKSGHFTPIERLSPGDFIYDGNNFVEVLNVWDKGIQPVKKYHLNNGASVICTDGHRMFVVPQKKNLPGRPGDEVEILASELKIGNDLLQPYGKSEFGSVRLDPDHALLLGAYIAEGWFDPKQKETHCQHSIAGIRNSKMLREKCEEAAKRLGIRYYDHARYISFYGESQHLFEGCGRGAENKRLPHLNYDRQTLEIIVGAMESGDGGWATNGKTFVYSTTSLMLAAQYCVAKRMLGYSVASKHMTAEQHGGAGTKDLYRITVRANSWNHNPGKIQRPWAKITKIESDGLKPTYDIETTSGRIYLPISDVITHNCDDFSSLGSAALMSLGIPTKFKVIRTKDADQWNHIYLMAGYPKNNPTKWMALDASVPVQSGWEAPASMVAESKVYDV